MTTRAAERWPNGLQDQERFCSASLADMREALWWPQTFPLEVAWRLN
jgi:hypothetical protein